MLYTLIGNGTPNKRETLASLDSLAEAAIAKDGDFWMLLVDEESSDTKQAIVNWLDNKSYYYEIVATAEDEAQLLGEYAHVGTLHHARRPVQRALSITPARAAVDEPYAVLVMSDNLDEDESCLLAVSHCVDNGIPVFDLAGQMTPLTVEEEEPPPAPTPVDQDPLEVTKEDLAALTRDELKSLVTARGLVNQVSDMRSKDAMIAVLLGVPEAPSEPEQGEVQEIAPEPSESLLEPSEEPVEVFYFLLAVRGPEDYDMAPVNAKQAQRLLFPDQD